MTELLKYKARVESQFGQDGVLAEIFRRIGERSRWCVELGAYDGLYLSNTWALINQKGWSGVQIEQDLDRYNALNERYRDNDCVYSLQAKIQTNLDEALSQTPLPKEFDLLVIDVDNDDYHIWDTLKHYHPRVVCIETNPTFGSEAVFVPKLGLHIGSSLAAITELANRKGYILAAYIGIDAIFVEERDFGKLKITDRSLHEHFQPSENHTALLVSDLDGQHYLLRGGPWGAMDDVDVLKDHLHSRLDLIAISEQFAGAKRNWEP